MTDCSICGKPAATRAFVEGAALDVCPNCVSYGREIRQPPVRAGPVRRALEHEIAGDYALRVRTARERRGESLHDLARRLFINEDYLKQIEGARRPPDEKTARKLESGLGIKLVTEEGAQAAAAPEAKGNGGKGSFTLGDIVEIRQARK